MRVIIMLVGGVFAVGMVLDFLHLFGLHIPEIPLMLAIAAVVALFYGKKIIKTLDYLFVKYDPATGPSANLPGAPTFHYENQAERERALSDKLGADTEIAQATVRLERARAALADAEQAAAETNTRQ
jgi:hypothetical protein